MPVRLAVLYGPIGGERGGRKSCQAVAFRRAMPRSWRALCFPSPPRDFSARRALKIALRAGHALTAAVFVGGVVLVAPEDQVSRWALAAALTGLLLLALDLYATAVFLLEVRGLVVVAKVLLVGLAAALPAAAPWLVASVFVASVLSSHAPGRIRHRTWAGGRSVVADRSRG